MFPMDRKPVRIAVEYTARGKRVLKEFDDPYKARAFFAQKLKSGNDPKVKKVEK